MVYMMRLLVMSDKKGILVPTLAMRLLVMSDKKGILVPTLAVDRNGLL
jgi:hypothetical protein